MNWNDLLTGIDGPALEWILRIRVRRLTSRTVVLAVLLRRDAELSAVLRETGVFRLVLGSRLLALPPRELRLHVGKDAELQVVGTAGGLPSRILELVLLEDSPVDHASLVPDGDALKDDPDVPVCGFCGGAAADRWILQGPDGWLCHRWSCGHRTAYCPDCRGQDPLQCPCGRTEELT